MATQPIHRNPIKPAEHPVRLPKRSAPAQHPVGHPALAARVKMICTLAMRD